MMTWCTLATLTIYWPIIASGHHAQINVNMTLFLPKGLLHNKSAFFGPFPAIFRLFPGIRLFDFTALIWPMILHFLRDLVANFFICYSALIIIFGFYGKNYWNPIDWHCSYWQNYWYRKCEERARIFSQNLPNVSDRVAWTSLAIVLVNILMNSLFFAFSRELDFSTSQL